MADETQPLHRCQAAVIDAFASQHLAEQIFAIATGKAVFEDAEVAAERLPWGREEARLQRQLQG